MGYSLPRINSTALLPSNFHQLVRVRVVQATLWALLIATANQLAASTPPGASHERLGLESPYSHIVSRLAANEQYDAALALTDSLAGIHPDNPYLPFLKATILNSRAFDFEDELDDSMIIAACKQVERLCRKVSNAEVKPAEVEFYLGTVKIYRMMIRPHDRFRLSVFKYIFNASNHFKKALKIDSSCWDAYYGLGMYKYYRSSRAGLLRTIGLISDSRQEGIEDITVEAEKGSITALAARNSLAWIDIEGKRFADAAGKAATLLERFPNRRAFLWCRGRALISMNDWQGALEVYGKLLSSVRAESRNNHYNEIGCINALAKCHAALGQWESVLRYATEALNLEIKDVVRSRKRRDLKNLAQLAKLARKRIDGDGITR